MEFVGEPAVPAPGGRDKVRWCEWCAALRMSGLDVQRDALAARPTASTSAHSQAL
jgi:aryl carrier-like protein